MSRFLELRQSNDSNTSNADTPTQRLAKYVPGDFLVYYTTAVSAATTLGFDESTAVWVAVAMAIIGSIAVAIYFWRSAPPGSVRRAQLLVSPIAFLTLAYPMSASLLGSAFKPGAATMAQVLLAVIALAWTPRNKT